MTSFFSRIKNLLGIRQKPGNLMDPVTFANYMAKQIRQQRPNTDPQVVQSPDEPDKLYIQLNHPKMNNYVVFIDNIYHAYSNQPKARDQLIQQSINSLLPIEDDKNQQSEDPLLLPVLKPLSWANFSLEQMRQYDESVTELPMFAEPLAGDLVLTYVADTTDSMQYITRDGLAMYNLTSLQELHQKTMANLRALLPKLNIIRLSHGYGIALDANYEASMVLIFDHWREQIEIAGDPVLAIIARDQVIICGSEEPENIKTLRNYAENASKEASYGLSGQLYTIKNNQLALYS